VSDPAHGFDPSVITRPDERLMTYYLVVSILTFVAFPITIITLYIKYRTLRYRFDEEGVWRRQGLLWRREVNVAYRRIQDIHLTSNLVERWLGLARIQVQTASGSSSAEMTIEGLHEFERVRDFLYARMRGHSEKVSGTVSVPETVPDTELAGILRETAASLQEAAEILRSRRGAP